MTVLEQIVNFYQFIRTFDRPLLAEKKAWTERPLLADCVEKVGPSKLPAYWLLKTSFLRAATLNLRPQSSDQSKDFNLKRILFCGGNHGRLFQHNRPISADQQASIDPIAASHLCLRNQGHFKFSKTISRQNRWRADRRMGR